MGAQYLCEAFPGSVSKTKIIEHIQNLVTQAEGHEEYKEGYGGSWGQFSYATVDFKDKVFEDEEAAHDWLDSHLIKRGNILAVRVLTTTKHAEFEGTETVSPFDARIAKANDKLDWDYLGKFNTELISRVKSTKSKTKGCTKCGSSIARAYIQHSACPVCRNEHFLYTATDIARLDRLHAKHKKQKAVVEELQKKKDEWWRKKVCKYTWLVSALAGC